MNLRKVWVLKMNNIELRNVTFEYPGGFKAVENVSMLIKKGEKIAIIGQNGAGKTTTVKMMNGLLRPKIGEVLVNGEDISNITTATVSRKVGYVFQNPGDQLFNSTVYNEIAYTLRHEKMPESEINKRVIEAAKLCHIEDYLDLNPYDLPFGLRKFVTIAISIANDCETIILDEPTAGQDLFGIEWLTEIINNLHNKGKTIITITHDMNFVIDNFERVIVMAHKNVIGDGNINEIFWNFDILQDAALKQPIIAELARKLKFDKKIVTIKEFLEYCK